MWDWVSVSPCRTVNSEVSHHPQANFCKFIEEKYWHDAERSKRKKGARHYQAGGRNVNYTWLVVKIDCCASEY